MIVKIYDQSLQKYGTPPGLNSQPLDLQSDSLPTALGGTVFLVICFAVQSSQGLSHYMYYLAKAYLSLIDMSFPFPLILTPVLGPQDVVL